MAGTGGENPYDDEPTTDELKVLDQWTKNGGEPPSEDEGGTGTTVDQAQVDAGVDPATGKPAAAAAAAEAAPAGTDAAAAAAAAAAGADAGLGDGKDADLAAFLEKHKDKSPAELATLLWQQSKRSAATGFRARKSQEQIRSIVTGAEAALERKKADIASRRAEFKEQLATDPDGATLRVKEELLDREEAEAEAGLHSARVDAALELASAAIPDFDTNIRETLNFGLEMNYTHAELGEITDGRDLVTLFLASRFANLVKAGVCDLRGNLVKLPDAVNEAPQDPRLAAAAAAAPVTTLSSAPARASGAGKTVEDTAHDVLRMSDEDFDKIPAKELENMLKNLQ